MAHFLIQTQLAVKKYHVNSCHTVLYIYLYTNYIHVTRHADDDHRSGRNMLLKNNIMLVNIFIEMNLLVNYVRIKGKAIPLQAWTSPEGSRRLI